ncbi:MAG: hypothetical protein HKN12_06715, partial [Gemmatimonadetes bacterium]|nr:hypothetical protein [Gemmatimonadota bacterium]
MLRVFIATLVLAGLVAGPPPAPAFATELLYGISTDGALLLIDPGSGTGSQVSATGVGTWEALDNGPDGFLYGIGNANDLYRIHPFSGAATLVGDVTGANRVEALAFHGGELFAAACFDANGARAERLIKISTVDASMTEIGLFGTAADDIDGLASWNNGLLGSNICTENKLVSINAATGMGTDVALLARIVISLETDANDVVYG